MKHKELIEQAAKKYSGISYDRNDYKEIYYHQQGCTKYDAFIEGAKWHAERMYSEEEVHKIIESYQNIMENNPIHTHYDKWFEQFKKK